MNAWLRHLAARLWLTAFSGGLLALALIAWLQESLGLNWVLLPAILVLAGCFAGIGWLMNTVGMQQLQRHVKEAGVWDQAGMTAEALAAYDRVIGLFDSFWLSPVLRRKKMPWIAGRLARFYLSRSVRSAHARLWMAAYLGHFPDDETIAVQWLEQLRLYPTLSATEQETASRIGHRYRRSRNIQHLLMTVYVAGGRTDYDALQTYRRMVDAREPLPREQVSALARLLIDAAVLNHWAFRLYIHALRCGEHLAAEGIAAGLRWLPRDSAHRGDFTAAEALMAGIEQRPNERILLRFKPVDAEAGPGPAGDSVQRSPLGESLAPAWGKLQGAILWLARCLGHGVMQPRFWAIVLVPAAAFLIWVAGKTIFSRSAETPPAPVPTAEAPVHNDPFTIQVAAYLKSDDAQRFVDQLIAEGLDAYWTKASSANRTWYQVKVSHFASKAAARAYGLDLKSKGVIDDFYVANYDRAAESSKKHAVE